MSTDNFNLAIDFVLSNEGGYVNDPADPGGETNFGISKAFWPNIDVKNLTRKKAKVFYRKTFWNNSIAQSIIDPALSAKIFDFEVWFGHGGGMVIVDASLKRSGDTTEHNRLPGEIAAIVNNIQDTGKFLGILKDTALGYLQMRINKNHGLEKFYEGWKNRVMKDV